MRPFLKAFSCSLMRQRHQLLRFAKRTYLSSAFACNNTWDSRLNHKIFQQVNSEVMYYELDNTFNRIRKLSAIDVDIFVNAQNDESFITEVEELIYKLRTTEETGVMLPTTHHAVIRLFLKCRRHEDLIRILNDRLNYGIFPDYYCSMLLLDHFIKAGDFRNAAKVGVLNMYQEDYSHEVVKYMSLFAIHKYLLTDQLWDDPIPPPVEDGEEEEEIKVRVPFLRNPYFDNHFDLVDRDPVCGKSLLMISSKLKGTMRQSYRLMGLALFNLWDKMEQELIDLIVEGKKQSEPILFAEALDFTRNFVKESLLDSDILAKISDLLNQIDYKSCIQDSLVTALENEMKKQVEKHEKNEILNQEKLYKEWEILREERLATFLANMTRRQRLKDVERRKEELKHQEELMNYFENEDEIDLVIEVKEKKLKQQQWDKMTAQSEDEYVPPEIKKRLDTKTSD